MTTILAASLAITLVGLWAIPVVYGFFMLAIGGISALACIVFDTWRNRR